jgi:hypothetical protein
VADSLHQQKKPRSATIPRSWITSLRNRQNQFHVVGRGSENLLLPGGRELLGALVVASQAVDTALNQNQAELGVLVLAIPLQMLAHRDGLLDQVVQILGDLRAQTCTVHMTESLHQLHPKLNNPGLTMWRPPRPSEKEERRIRTRRLPCETPESSLLKRGAFQCGIQKV